jgi:hypothetical protein
MKYLSLILMLIGSGLALQAQKNYPEPEFSNEVYYLKKDSVNTVLRLEKGSSKMETKTKMGGIGGAESGYIMDGGKSAVRISSGRNLSFIFSTGASVKSASSEQDSIMKANGFDPSAMGGMGAMDVGNSVTLYKAESEKGIRKILIQKSPGAFGLKKKIKSSDKYTFSVKKIREGYSELVIDKSLPRGEYIFTVMSMGMSNMDGSMTLFAFAVD